MNVTDSQYKEKPLKTAKNFRKISSDYEIPKIFQNNIPLELQPIVQEFQSRGFFKPYPFGSELTEEEQVIKNILSFLKNCTKLQLIFSIVRAFLFFENDIKYNKYLQRMKLNNPRTIKNCIYKKLLKFLIREQSESNQLG